MLEVAIEELKKVAMDFYNVAKIKIVLYDAECRLLYSYPQKMEGFCAEIRTNDTLAKKCFECDKIGFEMCRKNNKPFIYKCHMNLSEAIAPITENGVIIGYLMLGQVLMDEDTEAVKKKIDSVAEKYNLKYQELINKMSELQVMNCSSIESSVNIMSMCALYLYINRIIRNRSDLLCYQIKDYVDNHFTDEITVSKICGKFYISKSKLYAVSKEIFGMGVSDYIRLKRLEYAKAQLLNSEIPVFQVAEQSGFTDYNYFVRLFKKYEGITPNKYRKINLP